MQKIATFNLNEFLGHISTILCDNCFHLFMFARIFPGGAVVKNLPATQETQEMWARSLGREDPLLQATHSSILAWRIPIDRGAWRATVYGVANSWT